MNRKTRLNLAGLAIGTVGSLGKAFLLRHELVDCLPYKEANAPLYASIADIGIWLAPLAAILAAVYFVRRSVWLSLAVPVGISPITFTLIYWVADRGSDTIGYGDLSAATAAKQFYSYSTELFVAGILIALLIAACIVFFTRPPSLR